MNNSFKTKESNIKNFSFFNTNNLVHKDIFLKVIVIFNIIFSVYYILSFNFYVLRIDYTLVLKELSNISFLSIPTKIYMVSAIATCALSFASIILLFLKNANFYVRLLHQMVDIFMVLIFVCSILCGVCPVVINISLVNSSLVNFDMSDVMYPSIIFMIFNIVVFMIYYILLIKKTYSIIRKIEDMEDENE